MTCEEWWAIQEDLDRNPANEAFAQPVWDAATEQAQQRIDELEAWIAAIADDHPEIPDWIQQSARSLLAQEQNDERMAASPR